MAAPSLPTPALARPFASLDDDGLTSGICERKGRIERERERERELGSCMGIADEANHAPPPE